VRGRRTGGRHREPRRARWCNAAAPVAASDAIRSAFAAPSSAGTTSGAVKTTSSGKREPSRLE
jgi:hypothetical protein